MAKPRQDRTRADTAAGHGDTTTQTCAPCLDPDPQVRYTHYLALARQMDFDGVELHLWQSFRERTGFDAEVARSYITDLMYWVKDQVLSYSGIADEHTGAKLRWWEGREQTILALRRSTEAKAKEAEAVRAAREQGYAPRHVALAPLHVPLATVLREPGEDEMEDETNAAD